MLVSPFSAVLISVIWTFAAFCCCDYEDPGTKNNSTYFCIWQDGMFFTLHVVLLSNLVAIAWYNFTTNLYLVVCFGGQIKACITRVVLEFRSHLTTAGWLAETVMCWLVFLEFNFVERTVMIVVGDGFRWAFMCCPDGDLVLTCGCVALVRWAS